MYVIGTAGHVDHGKSTLVEALTGIDPDRLREEKEREMTIVLGFAWLTLPNGEPVGIIDVPGHKDFIKNMLSGVGGIDTALLVIAADEGMMPQTREHLAILDLLQVRGGVIALTKIDLIEDREWLDLVAADIMEQVENTSLADAPIVPVSAHTGEGLDALVAELQNRLQGIQPRTDRGRPRLPVDRVFTIAGFGTVVTGTLIDGTLRVGQEVEILPSGRRARIRGLQTHKTRLEEALPGSRVAVNLTGVAMEEVTIGDVVTAPGWLRPTMLVDVQLRHLADAPFPLRHNTEVDFFSGAAEVPARVRLLGADSLAPGETGWARIRLSQPLALVRGDRFIIRRPSPSITIGGGAVVDPAPRRRHRRFKEDVVDRLQTLAHGTTEEVVLQALERQQPGEARELVQRLTIPVEQIAAALDTMLVQGQVLILDDLDRTAMALPHPESSARFLVSVSGWQEIGERLRTALQVYHREHPLRRGMPREELRSHLQQRLAGLNGKLFNQIIGRAVHEGILRGDENSIWLAEHTVVLTPEQQQKVDRLLSQFRAAPYATPSVAESIAELGDELFNALLEAGTLERLNAEVVFLRQTVKEMQSRVIQEIRDQGSITVAGVRDLFGTSRKYALALMEYLDQQRVTKRVGDTRTLR